MARPTTLTVAAIDERLRGLPLWRREGACLARDLEFPSFARAMAFLAAGALEAERLDHHPDWRNVYARVWVRLSTHDPRGITELDFVLAARLDEHAAALGS
ncbi:MAG: 4a-hydroxytetrahydrobiopterin dehydratase [Planctomycetaceae bacterium]|nr:4a-hydroxytetrahydrobiopterin dehydratase [Planctomycetaceae bacterium]